MTKWVLLDWAALQLACVDTVAISARKPVVANTDKPKVYT